MKSFLHRHLSGIITTRSVLLIVAMLPQLALAQNEMLTITPQTTGVVRVTSAADTSVTDITCGTENRTGSSLVQASTDYNDCQHDYTSGEQVRLTATANYAYRFIGWLGDCTGSTRELTVQMDSARTCRAIFVESDGYTKTSTNIGNGTKGYACAVTAQGTIDCWGNGDNGRLGNGSTDSSSTPVAVTNMTSAIAVSLGSQHACALLTDGIIQCWGTNGGAQLGTIVSGMSLTPTTVTGATAASDTILNAIAVDAGENHTCALLADGAIRCWGAGGNGRLGNDGTSLALTPAAAMGITDAIAVSAGAEHSCAVLGNGRAQCWGAGANGRLGNGDTSNSFTPVTVTSITNAVAISAGQTHSCAVLGSGQVQCWGEGKNGRLGNGGTDDSSIPVPVTGIADAIATSVGQAHSCAILSDGQAQCWGVNNASSGDATAAKDHSAANNPRLGSGSNGGSLTPVNVANVNTVADISAGRHASCAVLRDSLAYCWGFDTDGQIGNGVATAAAGYNTPQLVIDQAITPASVERFTAVNTLFIFQPKLSQPINSWSLEPDIPAGMHFSTATGILYGIPNENQASTTSYTLTAQSDAGNSSRTLILATRSFIGIAGGNPEDRIVPENSPNIDVTTATLSFTTVTVVGTTITPDETRTIPASWQITNSGTPFAIDDTTGVIRLTGSVNYEMEDSYTLSLAATATDGSGIERTADLTIPIANVIETITINNAGSAVSTIAENTPVNTPISSIALVATDERSTTITAMWSITNSQTLFAIGTTSGRITLAESPDFEDNMNSRTITVRASATDAPSVTTTTSLTINITNLLETLSIEDSNNADNTIVENETAGTVVRGISLVARDEASTVRNDVLWEATTDITPFAISSNGVITLAQASLNYETTPRYSLTVQASIGSITSDPLTLTVNVVDIFTLTIIESAGGVVHAGSDIECGTRDRYGSALPQATSVHTNCSHSYDSGSTVTLVATPNHAQTFVGWLGDCQGESSRLLLTLDSAMTCQAVFTEPSGYIQMAVNRASEGLILSSDPSHVCALAANGSIHCWGDNDEGQLGDGTDINRPTPVAVSGLNDAIAITTGYEYSCAVLSDGTARCWGNNGNAQLGSVADSDSLVPVPVADINTAIAIAAGFEHTCALLQGGQVRCWGSNGDGQSGGDTNNSLYARPTTVSGINTAVAIAAGSWYTCAVLSDGQARCWGENSFGQLGDGTTANRTTPTPVLGINTAVAIAAGHVHTCAVLSDGQARCWGNNSSGQLGNGTTRQSVIPVAVSGIDTAIAVSAGHRHTCATLSNGQARCWGWNGSGRIGNDVTTTPIAPPMALSIPAVVSTTATSISGGEDHTCALLSNGQARCWGDNYYGQLGDGTTNSSATPTAVLDISTAIGISAGSFHSCAVLSDGQARCWGGNDNGGLGNGTTERSATPTAVSGIGNVTAISAGDLHSCAVLSDGQARCWGNNSNGQLGDGTDMQRTIPTPVSGINNAIAISAGFSHTCAVLSDGQARCWGNNSNGQLGDGTDMQRTMPTPVSGINNAIAISAGLSSTCAVLSDGQARCWGDINPYRQGIAQLGDGTVNPSTTPVTVLGVDTAVAISVGEEHTCTLLRDGQARCWGFNSHGQLGDGTNIRRLVQTPVLGIDTAVVITAGGLHTCAVLRGGQIRCWGFNESGQLGDGVAEYFLRPAMVSGIGTATQLVAGRDSSCALLQNGLAYCWGHGASGQLGNPAAAIVQTTPLLVANQPQSPNTLQQIAVTDQLFVFQPRVGTTSSTVWSISPPAPAGLRFSTRSGALYGISTTTQPAATYTITARNAAGSTDINLNLSIVVESITISDTNPAVNAIGEDATTDTVVTSISLSAIDERGSILANVIWNRINGSARFAVTSNTGIITLVDTNNLIVGTTATLVVQATGSNGIQSNELTLEIAITEAIQDIRFHLKLFLEGPLQ